jgi:hypothetical protein
MAPVTAVTSSLRRQAVLRPLMALTLAFLALAAAGTAWADPPGRVGRLAEATGTVWLYDDDQGEWVQARRNRPITQGDRLSAEQGARAEVQIGAATVRLDGGTDLEFAQLDDARVHVRLHAGTVALRVRGQRDGDFGRDVSVLTREGRYEPLRPGRYRVDARDNGSLGAALSGRLRFESDDSLLDLEPGQRAEFWRERGRTHYAWADMPNDRFSDWVAREEREDDRERERYRHVSPEMTGAEDLDRYGNWDRHPDYGTIWYPTTVAVGWSPYRYGHWAHIRPWGWTWVDDAPWGFAPFHYGRWVHWSGRWGWVPGAYVVRPVYAPALVAWFGGSNVSVGISIGGPAVGWVPLAPREVYYPTYHVTNIYVRNVNSPYHRWHGPNPRYERTVPTGPIMYTNQGVAGGVTVVPQNVMRGRQPISSSVVLPVDARTVSSWRQEQPSRQPVVPVAPPPRVTAVPGGAVPSAPGTPRNTPWGQHPGRVTAAQGDGGQAQHGHQRGQGRERRDDAPPMVQAPPQSRRDTREQGREQDQAERRVMPVVPQQAVPGVRPVQPAQPQQAMPPQPRPQPPQHQQQQQQQVQVVQPPQAVAVQPAPGAAPPQARGHQQEGRSERPQGPPQHRAQRDEAGSDRGQRRGESREQQNR